MKKPRLPTPEELQHWHESNKLTVRWGEAEDKGDPSIGDAANGAGNCSMGGVGNQDASGAAGSASPLAGEATRLSAKALSRSGEGASGLGDHLHRPLTPTLSRKERGGTARHALPQADLQAMQQDDPFPLGSSRGKSPAPPLSPLTTREAARRFKPHAAIEATLDLHGLTQYEAQAQVQQFIARAVRNGLRHVAIITGKGRGAEVGVLRKHLPDWLNEPPLRALISGFAAARPEKGGAGVTHVLLKRPR